MLAFAAPCAVLAQPAADRLAAIARALENGASFLCTDCDNDIEAEGVNRPMRRAMLAAADVERAEDLALEGAAAGASQAAMALVEIRAAREALDGVDEAAALAAIHRALALLAR